MMTRGVSVGKLLLMLYDYKEKAGLYGLVWFHEGKIGQALVLWEVCIFYYTKGRKGIGGWTYRVMDYGMVYRV